MKLPILAQTFLALSFWGALPAIAQTIDAEAVRQLKIEPAARKAIEKWNPRFTSYEMSDFPPLVKGLFSNRQRELPMAVRGDFNGDGATDYAVLGFDARKTYVIFALKFPRGYKVKVAHQKAYQDPRKSSVTNGMKTEPGLPIYIGLAEKEEIGASQINSMADVLFYETFGGANALYQVKGERPQAIPELFGKK